MKGFNYALSLFLRWCGGGLALALAAGSVARADWVKSGSAYGKSWTIQIRKSATSTPTSPDYEVKLDLTGLTALQEWQLWLTDGAGAWREIMWGDAGSGGYARGVWHHLDGGHPFWNAVFVELDIDDDEWATYPWPADGYRLLEFSVVNTGDVWRDAGIFATEAPGVMWFRRRVGPGQTVDFAITVEATDTDHYYAALVDVAATNANNPTSVTQDGPDGRPVVIHQGVVPDESTASGVKTQLNGFYADLGSDSSLVTGGVPVSRVPSPSIPTATGAATNEHLTAVTDGLATVVQGGDKAVEAAIRELGTQAHTDASAVEDVLGALRGDVQAGNELLSEINDRAEAEKTRVDQALQANPSVGEMSSAGADASAEIRAAYGSRPTGKGYTLNASGAPNLTVAMPAAFGGQTFDLNPFQAGRFQTLCTWFRAATAWLVIGLLGGWAWSQVGEWTRGFSTLAQARGNAVVAGTGAQGTALVAAGLITVAIVTGTTTLLSWAFDDINFAAFVAVTTTNPVATIPTGILWMLDQVLPVAVIITAFVARITFNIYASTVFAGAAAVVRFIVP